jgi:hypothetical protein
VSNDHGGDTRIDRSVITQNHGGLVHPPISDHDDMPIVVTDAIIE